MHPADGVPPPAPLIGRRVLVVEDQYYLADDVRRVVQSLGGQVIGPVPTAAEALALAAREAPDLAVLDVNLNGDHSYPVAEALRARCVPFIFVTGYDHSTLDARFAGTTVLRKPVQGAALAAALSGLVSG